MNDNKRNDDNSLRDRFKGNEELDEYTRRKKAARKKKRLREKKIKKIRKIAAIVTAAIVLCIFIFIIISAVAKNNKKSASTNTYSDSKTDSSDYTENIRKVSLITSRFENSNKSEGPTFISLSKIGRYEQSNSYVDLTDDETIYSENVCLIDLDSAKVIAGRNYDKVIYPASMTKVMTLIVAVENLTDLSQTYTFTDAEIAALFAEDASMAGFKGGETVDVTDMLYGLALPSGADAAIGLAKLVAGSEDAFVDMMNEKCEELGLAKTHFCNPTGLHDDNHYSTCMEMGVIMAYAMSNELCAKILSTYQYTTKATPFHEEGIELTSTTFARMYGTEADGVLIDAGKTGYTYEAGQCLMTSAVKDNKRYVLVCSNAVNRYHTIYDNIYIYGNYLP